MTGRYKTSQAAEECHGPSSARKTGSLKIQEDQGLQAEGALVCHNLKEVWNQYRQCRRQGQGRGQQRIEDRRTDERLKAARDPLRAKDPWIFCSGRFQGKGLSRLPDTL
jgi:hypothetical protein